MTTYIKGTDNSAAAPAVTGTDGDTGLFFPAANTAAISTGGNEQLRIDSSGNVGIGTSSPAANTRLHVHEVSSSISRIRLTNSTTTDASARGLLVAQNGVDTFFTNNEAGAQVFSTNATERMRIDSSGNVGIGTSSPDSILTFAGNITSKGSDAYGIGTNGGNNHFNVFATGASGAVRFFTGGSSATSTGGGGTERARIDSSGSLLINATDATSGGFSPAFMAKQVSSTGLGSCGVQVEAQSSDVVVGIGYDPAAGYAAIFSSYRTAAGFKPLAFHVGGSYRAYFSTTGEFLMGTTSDYYQMSLQGYQNSARIGLLTIGRSGNEYPSVGYNVRYTGSTGSYTYNVGDTAAMIKFGQNGGRIETYTAGSGSGGSSISFTYGPYVAVGGTSWTSGSDMRLKENFTPLTNVLDKVMEIEIGNYTWKQNGRKSLGAKAQVVYEHYPEIVSKGDDLPEYDSANKECLSWGIEESKYGAIAIAAIQELKAELDSVKAELAVIKGA